MVDMFVNKVCYYCLKEDCSKKEVEMFRNGNCTTYKCNNYMKNKNKIVPYQEPLIVTADREYVTKRER